jgi:hypothetical protein
MFLRHARTAGFAVGYLVLFTASLVFMVPKVDSPATPFDETTTSTNEMVIQLGGASTDDQRLDTAVSLPKMFAHSGIINVSGIFPVYGGRLTDSQNFQELFCPLLC